MTAPNARAAGSAGVIANPGCTGPPLMVVSPEADHCDLRPQRKIAHNVNRTGGLAMKLVLSISTALLLAMSPWQPAAAQNNALVTQAVTALGGADALRNLKGVTITGEAKFW